MGLQKNAKLAIAVVLAILAAGIAYFYISQPKPVDAYHMHANFLVVLNGTAFNFSQDKYVSAKDKPSNPYFHLHDGNGGLMHQHAGGLDMAYFFRTLKMSFNSSCFADDANNSYCSNSRASLRMFVQHASQSMQENFHLGSYQFSDLDRMLIIYGNESDAQINSIFAQVTDDACIESGKCPERGKPEGEAGGCSADSGKCEA